MSKLCIGINFTANGQPGNWSVTAYDSQKYSKGIETVLWEKIVKDYVNLETD